MRARSLLLAAPLLVAGPAFAQSSGTPNYSNVGSDYSGSAPTMGSVLATCTARTPGGYRFQNQSAVTLQLVLDDGLGGTPSIFVYGAGGGAGSQGGDSSPEITWFVGRVRVAGAAGSQFALRCN